ncbi:Piso0_002923 [Millerozyma farinosa CBS 7064]|uniref:Dolichyl-diphosphooligosaccharide-protein glycosyltransferase subunit OST5 n=1 Tax=Pichia sorbitophila (strain ATCC MYA-4447 / BCRC 22081 / CBS 7064 / NBRC 10061 / NRRL Y-12695) TaxID=559304 RepID=G8YGP5_PICSO|nr:Piso0_002923 [Millerozyma farinosa CBS 7064]CCE80597.1 Piso0_002923 [Millerozyma farinosa CBS 7064]
MVSNSNYEELSQIYKQRSVPIAPSPWSQHSTWVAALLTVIAFMSLSLALLVYSKSKSTGKFLFNAIIASLSIGVGSIYVSNNFGVYV